jgi:hypothetical protein
VSRGDRARRVVAEPARLLLRLLADRVTHRAFVPSDRRAKRLVRSIGVGLLELVPEPPAQRIGERLATGLMPLDIAEVDSRWSFAQLAATFRLAATLKLRGPWPPMGGLRIGPDLAMEMVEAISETEPAIVVELGSGSSTVILAYALKPHGGRLVSFDHHATYAAASQSLLEAHGFTPEQAEVRLAPLHDVTIGDQTWPWYDIGDPRDIGPIDLLIVDGPPGTLHPMVRYPALPVLGDVIRPGGVVFVDDGGRADERAIVRRWQLELPTWTVEPLNVRGGGFRLRKAGPPAQAR